MQFLFAKGFAYSLKDKYKLLSKAKKKKPRKLSVCVAFAIILYANSALSIFYLSFYRNKYQKSDLVLHRAKCCEYFSVSSRA
ncbi:hypothetical protein PI172_2227 [Prevotella intermedia]|uniref:Uncharacterized protein n=1 Tax=Prevotella intermedia TaxID=28131 RepID=A0AAD1BKL3_PREIN|nr:hypothetical protein PIN17_0126 [Prevotella intermedia 17]BAR96955.1 hypothetical protein PI172_2227 [Prevotella intermedia]